MAQVLCDLCYVRPSLTDEEKAYHRSEGWLGVDFYPAICSDCFDKQKSVI